MMYIGIQLHVDQDPLSCFLFVILPALASCVRSYYLCFLYALPAALLCTPCELALLAWGSFSLSGYSGAWPTPGGCLLF